MFAVAYPKSTECILHFHLSIECSVVAVNIPNITGYIILLAEYKVAVSILKT